MSVLIHDLNALSSENVIAVLFEFTIPGSGTLRVCTNNEDITFGGYTYIPFPLDLEENTQSGKGENPEWSVKIDNTTRVMDTYLQEYDYYLKINGAIGNKVECACYVVNTVDLSQAILTEYWIVESWSANAHWVELKLSSASPLMMRYPRRRIIQNFCGWKFKGSQCGYTGSEASCDKTLAQCRARSNSGRFGGFPGVGKGIRL